MAGESACPTWLVFFLEKPVKSVPGVARAARSFRKRLRYSVAEGRLHAGRGVARHRNARRKQIALVLLVLDRDSDRNRLQALKTGRGLEVRALLATVKLGVALRTVPTEIDAARKRSRAVEAARGRHRLHKPRQAGAGYVDWGARAGLFWPVLPPGPRIPIRVHIARLSILSVAIHGGVTYSLHFVWMLGPLKNQ